MDDEFYLAYGNVYFEKLLEKFFADRLKFIQDNKYPAQLSSDPPVRFVMHFVPDKFLEIFLEIRKLDCQENHLLPLGEIPETILCDYNFDGLLFYSSVHEKHSYVQAFRDGRIEMVAAIAEGMNQPKGSYLPILQLQKNLLISLGNHLAIMHKFSLPGPFYLFFRLLSVENTRINPKDIAASGYEGKGRNKALIRNELVFPRYRLEHCEVNIKASLMPFFDILWNTFGFKGAPEFE